MGECKQFSLFDPDIDLWPWPQPQANQVKVDIHAKNQGQMVQTGEDGHKDATKRIIAPATRSMITRGICTKLILSPTNTIHSVIS